MNDQQQPVKRVKKVQTWQSEPGTYYAVNKQRKQGFRRVNDGPWEAAELIGKADLAPLDVVGWARIDDGWFSVYRLAEK